MVRPRAVDCIPLVTKVTCSRGGSMIEISSKRFRQNGTALVLVLMVSTVFAGSTHAQDRTYAFSIPAENTALALTDFSRQAGVQIFFPYEKAAAHTTGAISGQFTMKAVLARLIDGTGLEIAEQTDKSITLRAVGQPASAKAGNQADDATTQVIVTGTHIRGGEPTSPVHVLTRSDIDQSGYSQIGDLMRSLPENFSGGQNPGVFQANATNIANSNATNASTMNLRGLGSDATLVLLDGHRLAADYSFQGADVSGIPLAAVQRIEIVPDGASALYGSDAVAGVANFILRRNFNGGEASARVGATADGGGTENTYSVLSGTSKQGWYALGDLEVSRQDGIQASERSFTAAATPVTSLIPSQNRRSGFFGAGTDIREGMKVSLEALLSDRSTFSMDQVSPQDDAYAYPEYVTSHNIAATLDTALAGDWKLRATAVMAGSRDKVGTQTVGQDDLTFDHYANNTVYGELTADGTLWELPSGPLKAAVGGGYRRESYRNGLPGSAFYLSASRGIRYFYGEALVPVVAPSTTRTGLEELELSASARAETYSDFGSSTNPKLGLRYVPVQGLTLRASWGKSFKAPSFTQMYQSEYLYLWQAASVGSPANGDVLMTYGGNRNLKPERSTSWSVGGDYTPSALKSLTVSANYFDIDYTDRIVQPVPQYWLGLADPIYVPFVQASPSATEQAALMASAHDFFNFSGGAYDPSTVIAVLNDTYQNATAQTVRGVDLSYRQTFRLSGSHLTTFANATWLELNQRTIATVPDVRLSGTIFNAAKFKARGGVSWEKGGLSANAIVNYIAAEKDTAVSPPASVAGWTTVDANLSYEFSGDAGLASGVKISLAASNLFNKMPPHTVSPTTYAGVHFDSTNASILGRFTSLTLSKSW